MITSRQVLQIREKILQDPLFFSSYQTAIDWARHFVQERFSLSDHFRMLMMKNKWGRKSGYAFLQIIGEDYSLSDLANHAIRADLLDLENRILGHCIPAKLIRFHNDPADPEELLRYVRSEQWLQEEFYS